MIRGEFLQCQHCCDSILHAGSCREFLCSLKGRFDSLATDSDIFREDSDRRIRSGRALEDSFAGFAVAAFQLVSGLSDEMLVLLVASQFISCLFGNRDGDFGNGDLLATEFFGVPAGSAGFFEPIRCQVLAGSFQIGVDQSSDQCLSVPVLTN